MALKLILMRHAKSDWKGANLSDHDRPLNTRGRHDAPKIGHRLANRGHVPQVILCSTARRTVETYERTGLKTQVQFHQSLYHSHAETMMEILQSSLSSDVMIIAHNPGIAQFAEQIVAEPPDHLRFFDFPTAATLVVTFEVKKWKEVVWKQGVAIDFTVPKDLD